MGARKVACGGSVEPIPDVGWAMREGVGKFIDLGWIARPPCENEGEPPCAGEWDGVCRSMISTNVGSLAELYQDGLGRALDGNGRVYWNQLLVNGSSRAQFAELGFRSLEYSPP
jgi:hypothetical protein